MAEFDSGGEPVRKRHSEDYVAGGYCSFCLGHSHGASNCPHKPKPIATHDEMLAWIDDKLKQIEEASSVYGAPTGDGYRASLLANRAGLERHKERPFNWMTDQAIGMFSEAFPEPPQLPRCVTCRYENFPCPSYTDIAEPIRSVM